MDVSSLSSEANPYLKNTNILLYDNFIFIEQKSFGCGTPPAFEKDDKTKIPCVMVYCFKIATNINTGNLSGCLSPSICSILLAKIQVSLTIDARPTKARK